MRTNYSISLFFLDFARMAEVMAIKLLFSQVKCVIIVGHIIIWYPKLVWHGLSTITVLITALHALFWVFFIFLLVEPDALSVSPSDCKMSI